MSVFVQMVSSKPRNNTFITKLDIVMHHHEQECMQKDWFAIFQVKVIARAYVIKI